MSIIRENGLLPRMKQLSDKRPTIVSVLDVGTSKICCLIAKLTPRNQSEAVLAEATGLKSSDLDIRNPEA